MEHSVTTTAGRVDAMNDRARNIKVPDEWDRRGLPGWCYHSQALLELEKSEIFLKN